MEEVELHLAFTWVCNNCGRDNFTRGMIDEETDFNGEKTLVMPPTVTCKYCKTQYETTNNAETDPSPDSGAT